MNLLRSLLFNFVFFGVMGSALLCGTLLLPFDKRYMFLFWKYLAKILRSITKFVGGINVEIEGKENLSTIPSIYAIRHESLWETIMLIDFFQHPIFVLKKELLNIPIFGIMSKKTETIGIAREQGVQTLMSAAREVESSIKKGYSVVIFPEGTRMHSGEYVPLKRGIELFYARANCQVIPIIHNSGEFWPRRSFIKRPGTITLRILPPIAPGLPPKQFMVQLNEIFREQISTLKDRNVIRKNSK